MNINMLLKLEPLLEELDNLACRTIDVEKLVKYVVENELDFKDSQSLVDALDKEFLGQFPLILQKIILEEAVVPLEIPVQIQKKKYRVNGEVWMIHQNDADPFPSSPHAHNYDRNLSLHLGNAKLFRKREFVGNANWKNFLALRSKVINVDLPPLEK
jgi:hypothetical protein